MQAINAKYKLGQEVWKINWCNPPTWETCYTCNGSKFVHIKETNKQISCPDCRGEGGRSVFLSSRWKAGSKLTIGKIQIEQFDPIYSDNKNRVTYMCKETGIGTGSVHDQNQLFASLEAAEREVKKRNKTLEKEG